MIRTPHAAGLLDSGYLNLRYIMMMSGRPNSNFRGTVDAGEQDRSCQSNDFSGISS